MTTNQVVKNQVKDLCKNLGITYIKDVQMISSYLDHCYWVGRVEQQKADKKQQEMEKLWEVIPDVNSTYYN